MKVIKQDRVSSKVNGPVENKVVSISGTDPRNGFGISYEYIPRPEFFKAVEALYNVLSQSSAGKNYSILFTETKDHYTIELRMGNVPVIQTTANKGMEAYKEHAAKHFLTMICVKGINQIER